MKYLLLAAALLAPSAAAVAGCNAYDYTPWECGYVADMKNRQDDLEYRQRQLERQQQLDEQQRSQDRYDDALWGRNRY